jgi:hypothetical protein
MPANQIKYLCLSLILALLAIGSLSCNNNESSSKQISRKESGSTEINNKESGSTEINNKERSVEVEATMQHYNQLILKMDADAISSMYDSEGELSYSDNPAIHGPKAIRDFIASLNGAKFEEYSTTTDSITINGETAIQVGTFKQRVILSDNKSVEAHGKYKAEWLHNSEKNWLLHRMSTTKEE